MHKLKHPIATFVVTVLIVIAIGVGIVAATTSQTVYGPSWGRFTAAFSGLAHEERLPVAEALTNAYYYSFGGSGGWTSQVPFGDGVSAHHIAKVHLSQYVRETVFDLESAFPMRPTESTEHINGFQLTRLGPLCKGTNCQEDLFVLRSGTCWDVWAASAVGLGPVENFLASFQPIG